jgi:hypothetical protein
MANAMPLTIRVIRVKFIPYQFMNVINPAFMNLQSSWPKLRTSRCGIRIECYKLCQNPARAKAFQPWPDSARREYDGKVQAYNLSLCDLFYLSFCFARALPTANCLVVYPLKAALSD